MTFISRKMAILLPKIHFVMKTNKVLRLISFSLLSMAASLMLTSCEQAPLTDLTQKVLIPVPVEVSAGGEAFILQAKSRIHLQPGASELIPVALSLQSMLSEPTGFELAIDTLGKRPRKSSIVMTLVDESEMQKEGYRLTIEKQKITIASADAAGAFYGIQTLRQLFPDEIEGEFIPEKEWMVPTGTITDHPRFSYRGAMLDVARHFFTLDEVKRMIDYLAAYKMNRLHLHLSDDQGWRIEIKSWPKLTLHGGSSEVGGGPGGFYTQEEFKDLTGYATSRFVTIVPEIDMPGHTNAALASYPELNCNGRATALYTGTQVGFSSLCTKLDITYQFIDDVVREISQLSPGPWFHIGGDESHATKPNDYLYFINRVIPIVQSHGKTVMGWDDIAVGDLGEGMVAQYWAKASNARLAASKGARLVLSPGSLAYLDMKYDENCKPGLNWAGYIEVDKAYNWDPDTLVQGVSYEKILGIEAPLWSETVSNLEEAEYLLFPRLIGYAEMAWSPAALRNWDSYRERLRVHQNRLDLQGIRYYRSPKL